MDIRDTNLLIKLFIFAGDYTDEGINLYNLIQQEIDFLKTKFEHLFINESVFKKNSFINDQYLEITILTTNVEYDNTIKLLQSRMTLLQNSNPKKILFVYSSPIL